MFIGSAPANNLKGSAFAVGAVIAGRYEAQRKLGEFGMGAVYLARDVRLEK
jgi:serine/threonine protein kinase